MAIFRLPISLSQQTALVEDAPPPAAATRITALTPGITAIVAGLAALFSITFFLLLYVMYCKRPIPSSDTRRAPQSKRNSGVDRGVIELLPLFRFSAVKGRRTGVECAVCLSRFRPEELLRLLPKCKHAFHVECVDTWLDGHSTCPICRYRVDPEDVLLVFSGAPAKGKVFTAPRIPGRHSSAGDFEKSLEIVLENPGATDFRGRVSLDSWYWNSRRKNRKRRDEVLPLNEEKRHCGGGIVDKGEEDDESGSGKTVVRAESVGEMGVHKQ